jgi:hypothetical protein
MPAPIARMSLPPRSHSLYMDWAAKVGLVLRLLLPTSLSRRFLAAARQAGFAQYFCRPRLHTSAVNISRQDRHLVLLLFAMAPPKEVHGAYLATAAQKHALPTTVSAQVR